MIKRVLIDLSTQRDFLCRDGAIPVINHGQLLAKLRRAMAWARLTRTPVVSAVDSRRETDPFNGTPRHCLEGTRGYEKIPTTLLRKRLLLQVDSSLAVPKDLFKSFHQVILRKHSKDFLGNPKADRLLTETAVGEYVILGVGLESSIKSLALGLIARMKRVAVVYDACGYWNVSAADMALRQMEAKGGRLICVEELTRMRRSYPGRNGHRRLGRPHDIIDPSVPVPAFVRTRLAHYKES